MNNIEIESDGTAQPPPTTSRAILYFRFRRDVGGAIQQVEYDLLQTYLNQHRGYIENAIHLCRDSYWAVAGGHNAP